MNELDEPQDPAAEADEGPNLGAVLEEIRRLGTSIDQAAAAVAKNRRYVKVLAATIALVLALAVFVYGVANRAHDASMRANDAAAQVANDQRQACLSGNDARAAQLQVWDYLFGIATPPTDPAAVAQIAQFKDFINHALAPRQC